MYVKDADAVFESAIKAGAKAMKELENRCWGDRYAQVEDPFGHLWSISTKIENLTPQQLKKRVAQLTSRSI